MNDLAGRRARSGGGASRRAERTAVSFETARFIQRNIPNFEILNEEALQIIEWNAETVLEEIGVNFVDIYHPMLNAEAAPRPELFTSDMLHMNADGSALWRSILLPMVQRKVGIGK